MQGLTKIALAAWLSGAPRRIGFGDEKGRELSRWLNNELVTTTAPHIVDCNLQLLTGLGIDRPAVKFDLPESADDHAAAEAILATVGGAGSVWPDQCRSRLALEALAGRALRGRGSTLGLRPLAADDRAVGRQRRNADWPSRLWPVRRATPAACARDESARGGRLGPPGAIVCRFRHRSAAHCRRGRHAVRGPVRPDAGRAERALRPPARGPAEDAFPGLQPRASPRAGRADGGHRRRRRVRGVRPHPPARKTAADPAQEAA